jgi:hypothetical protein
MKAIGLILSGLILVGCAGTSKHESELSRAPSSAPMGQSCVTILNDLVDLGQSFPAPFRLADFPDLETEWIQAQPRLMRLVEMQGLDENREQAQIILALIRRNSPELLPDGIAKRYSQLFRECS